MFLFAEKHRTPISTYTDSYRPPCTMKKAVHERAPLKFESDNEFLTQGLTVPPVQKRENQGPPEEVIRAIMQDCYRNTMEPAAYWPGKYWLSRSEEKYNPVFVNEDKYITWRTGPYNSATWNKHSTYLPLLPKETRMETYLRSIPVPYPPKPACLNQIERDMVTDMLRRLSRQTPPSVQPVYTVSGRGPFQGYYSPCSGRHYCLRGMDYYIDGATAIRRHLNAIGERAVRTIRCCNYSPSGMSCASTHRPRPSSFPYSNPRWDSSHFSMTGGVQRGSFTIHPEFSSEAYYDL
ncbi:sperm microtubule inner protein 6 [Caloenas nicobarica]|uniref:sperm microtubule inner protein 6 n=1 Tax=Caloenas nicobarica TaxID=187106 RepID=UPI0032B6FC6E